MKMTFDLPADLVDRLKAKAAKDGAKLKDLIVQACSKFLSNETKEPHAKNGKHPFPIFKGGRKLPSGMELTPARVDEILWGSGN